MTHRASYLGVACAGLVAASLFFMRAADPPGAQVAAQSAPQKQPDAKAPAPETDADKDAVLANVRVFTEAYNRQDVPALLKLFTEDCVLTEQDGARVQGVKDLEGELKATFEDDADAKISTSIDSLVRVGPDVIVEEGKTEYFPDGKTLTAETEYEVTHVKKGDKWLMARVRSFNRVVLSPYDQLRDLEWLIGDWVDESPDSLIESSYRWDANKTFILQDFNVRVNGQKVLAGTQRIGRDPLTKQIKGWVFDDEGGFAENLWSEMDDSWIIRSTGVRSDGTVVTMTNQITPLGKDLMRIDSVDRIAGDERMPNMSAVVVRRPPQAEQH